MIIYGLLHVAQTAVWWLEMRVSLQGVSQNKLENYFEICTYNCVAQNVQKANALSASVLTIVFRNVISKLLVYILQLFIGNVG